MTPEGAIKKKVTALLKQYKDMYYFMPVISGYGQRSLDYLGCYKGKFFAIETKKLGGKLTDRQKVIVTQMLLAQGRVFVISDEDGLLRLHKWLEDEAGEESNKSVSPFGTT